MYLFNSVVWLRILWWPNRTCLADGSKLGVHCNQNSASCICNKYFENLVYVKLIEVSGSLWAVIFSMQEILYNLCILSTALQRNEPKYSFRELVKYTQILIYEYIKLNCTEYLKHQPFSKKWFIGATHNRKIVKVWLFYSIYWVRVMDFLFKCSEIIFPLWKNKTFCHKPLFRLGLRRFIIILTNDTLDHILCLRW